MSNSLTINTPSIVQQNTPLRNVPSGSTATPDYSVKFVPQDLTEEQQAQARQNIGAISATEVPAQVQADWNENDPADPSYIQNKPTISAAPLVGKYEPFFVQNITDSNETVQILNEDFSDYSITIESSTDGNTWTTLGSTSDTALTISLLPGDKVYLRSNAPVGWNKDSYSGDRVNHIVGGSKIGGNIMSLIYGENFTGNEINYPSTCDGKAVFQKIFENNTSLIDASELILTKATSRRHFFGMFTGCTSLVTAPKISNIISSDAAYCYCEMFKNCTSLGIAPELPATTLATSCYDSMFYGCSKLTVAPELPATTPAEYCYSNMFRDCTSLQKAPDLPLLNVLDTKPFQYMFYGCTALTHAPAMAPQTRNGNDASESMFRDCTSLVVGPSMKYSLDLWYRSFAHGFSGCTSLREIQIIIGDGTQPIVVQAQQNMFANVATYGVLYTVSWNDWTTNNIVPSTWRIVNLDESANTVPLTMTDANGNTIDGDFVAQNVTITPAV